ncbi:MAG: hypothetical protein Q9164_004822 [Protoblastenia rupestris]
MAAHEGEERLSTVFADIHYYFSAPSPRPLSHRFDKGSYLYLYGSKSGSGARLEIANNVGKVEQDAFTGTLESCTVRQSHKHPTLCTVTVGGYQDQPGGRIHRPEHHWKLPSGDPRNERPLLLHLHTVDIYFWTAQDADSFLSSVRGLLQHDQVEVLDAPSAPAPDEKLMSPVVQQLENVAIRDPAYHNGQNRSLSDTPTTSGRNKTPVTVDAAAFQPLAYNPAAPAAPEPIRHREKTPPPVDEDAGTGLAAAAYADQADSQSSSSRPSYGQTPSMQGYVGSPPGQPHQSPYTSPGPGPGRYTSPVPSATGQQTPGVSSFPPPPPQSGRSSINPQTPTPSFVPPSHSPQATGSPSNQQLTPAYSPSSHDSRVPQYDKNGRPFPSPATQILGSSYVGGAHQPLQHVQPQYADYLGSTGHQSPGPVGGYSNYSYNQQQQQLHQHQEQHHQQHQQQHQSHGSEYDIHNQIYRPSEEEIKKEKRYRPADSGPGQQPGRFEQHTGRVDKGVNRLFKKLEKRIG